MFRKICVICLSVCTAMVMILSPHDFCRDSNEQDTAVTMCILDATEELY